MNFRGDRRINEGERGGWGKWIGPCNNSGTGEAVTAAKRSTVDRDVLEGIFHYTL